MINGNNSEFTYFLLQVMEAEESGSLFSVGEEVSIARSGHNRQNRDQRLEDIWPVELVQILDIIGSL